MAKTPTRKKSVETKNLSSNPENGFFFYFPHVNQDIFFIPEEEAPEALRSLEEKTECEGMKARVLNQITLNVPYLTKVLLCYDGKKIGLFQVPNNISLNRFKKRFKSLESLEGACSIN